MKKAIAALLIAVSALVAGGVTTQAGAEPRGYRGNRGRSRSRRGRGWYRQPDPGALGGIIGGVFGSWLWNEMNKDEADEREQDERDQRAPTGAP